MYLTLVGICTVLLAVGTTVALASSSRDKSTATAVETVRQATAQFKNVRAATRAGYGLFHGCTSGPQEGAMGIHLVNGDLVGDGKLEASQPEALLYEPKGEKLRLVGVEYIVDAEAWNDSHNGTPPVLMGQMFNYVGAPNRYGIAAFYELHVWAWERNPNGTFADWNPRVSCDDYVGDSSLMDGHH
jgi:hypothetical protein